MAQTVVLHRALFEACVPHQRILPGSAPATFELIAYVVQAIASIAKISQDLTVSLHVDDLSLTASGKDEKQSS